MEFKAGIMGRPIDRAFMSPSGQNSGSGSPPRCAAPAPHPTRRGQRLPKKNFRLPKGQLKNDLLNAKRVNRAKKRFF
jgi:hypothetical protein